MLNSYSSDFINFVNTSQKWKNGIINSKTMCFKNIILSFVGHFLKVLIL